MTQEEKDVLANARYLLKRHPAPWCIYDNGFDGYVQDANGYKLFGGEPSEGRVSSKDKGIVALVDVVNSLAVWITPPNLKGDL